MSKYEFNSFSMAILQRRQPNIKLNAKLVLVYKYILGGGGVGVGLVVLSKMCHIELRVVLDSLRTRRHMQKLFPTRD